MTPPTSSLAPADGSPDAAGPSSDGSRAAADTDHWARKRRELDLLRGYAGGAPDPAPATSMTSYLAAARAMRLALRVHQAATTGHLFETSQDGPGASTHVGPFGTVSYGYQRYDLTLTDIDWLTTIHGRPLPDRATDGLYVGSGMSAVTAVLSVLARAGHRRISMSPMAYFETFQSVRSWFPSLSVEVADAATLASDADIAWLDTSSTAWPALPAARGTLAAIVVDTTCVEADSPHVAGWLADGARLGLPVILVRSHLKLDTFGVELGKLGSVIVVGPDAAPDPVAAIAADLRRVRAAFGLGFEVDHLHPWLGTPDFLELSRLRTAGIRATTAALADAVEAARRPGDTWTVIRPPHALFFTIRTGITFPDDAAAKAYALCRALAARCADDGIPAFAGTSFGLDRIVFLEFVELRDERHYLRVAGADLPWPSVEPLAAVLRDGIAAAGGRA